MRGTEVIMIINPSFTFGTWNAARGADYNQLFLDREDAPDTSPNLGGLTSKNAGDKEMLQSIDLVREKLLGVTAEMLTKKADVYALQEVEGDDRADIQAFKDAGFTIIRPPRIKNPSFTDTAIAINPSKFEEPIENRSYNDAKTERDVTIAVAIEKATGKKIAFISGHIGGFNLEEKDPKIMKESAAEGDGDVERLIETLKDKCSDCDLFIMGADMNATPEIYENRFKSLKEDGFDLYRTNVPTSHMERTQQVLPVEMKDRELDYIFFKENKRETAETPNKFFAFLNRLFKKKTVIVAEIKKNDFLTLDAISSPSDHIPVFVKVEAVKKSLIGEFFRKIFG